MEDKITMNSKVVGFAMLTMLAGCSGMDQARTGKPDVCLPEANETLLTTLSLLPHDVIYLTVDRVGETWPVMGKELKELNDTFTPLFLRCDKDVTMVQLSALFGKFSNESNAVHRCYFFVRDHRATNNTTRLLNIVFVEGWKGEIDKTYLGTLSSNVVVVSGEASDAGSSTTNAMRFHKTERIVLIKDGSVSIQRLFDALFAEYCNNPDALVTYVVLKFR